MNVGESAFIVCCTILFVLTKNGVDGLDLLDNIIRFVGGL